jgi:hypothetical protein
MNPKPISYLKGMYSLEYGNNSLTQPYKNFLVNTAATAKRKKVYYLRTLHRETHPLASAKARDAGLLQLSKPKDRMVIEPTHLHTQNCKNIYNYIYKLDTSSAATFQTKVLV